MATKTPSETLYVGGAPAVETTTTRIEGGTHIHRRISWAAIFGGVILVVAVQLLLGLSGAGIGLGTVNTNPAASISWIWFSVVCPVVETRT
jgi:hypothetical protein